MSSNNNTFIDTDRQDGVAVIHLNRPDKLNSFTREMASQLQQALRSAADDEEIRCVFLTGDGSAFCAGQDLPEVLERRDQDEDYKLSDTVQESYLPLIKLIRKMPKPVVCAVNGTAAGAGANLALACDFVLASDEARFIQAFSKIGLIPDTGGTWLLPRLVGQARARALTMLGEPLDAQQAEDWGMIYRCVEDKKLIDESMKLARQLSQLPTRALALTKQALDQAENQSFEEQLELEARLQAEAGETEDFEEGVQAFLNKRKPQFKGK